MRLIEFINLGGPINWVLAVILCFCFCQCLERGIYFFQTRKGSKNDVLKRLQEKYPGKDMESRTALAEETQKLYKEKGVNPYASFIPLFIQMPVLLALFQALTRVDFMKTGHFLWLNLGATDPTFILPLLAALFTFLSTWLSNKALPERNGGMTVMMYLLPVAIFFFAFYAASGVALYWAVSNAYQVVQTLLLSNPFKIIAEREAKERSERQLEQKKKRALKKAQKKKK